LIVIATGRPSATATSTAINSTALGCTEVSFALIAFRLTTAFSRLLFDDSFSRK
jgi:hypothetical protein